MTTSLKDFTLILMDQRKCCDEGSEFNAEKYLEQHPTLHENSQAALDIIYNEICLREEQGETIDLGEYVQRFPQFAKELKAQFEIDQFLDSNAALGDTVGAGPGDYAENDPTARLLTSEVSRYRAIRLHARGGLGEVHVAQDEELQREVALKEIQEHHAHDGASRARFVREAELTGRLEHPGIVPVYGLSAHSDGRPFYAMRFIQGESFKDAIERFHSSEEKKLIGERLVQLRQLLKRFQDSCHAIAYAHSRGVIHRDIKPDNIMLGEFGETLVVDWGLARGVNEDEEISTAKTIDAGPEVTQAGTILGTPAFMSPEQAMGRTKELTPVSDVHSLGATLYFLLTGETPFQGTSIRTILKNLVEGNATLVRQMNPHVPASLAAICHKAMARRPDDRYSTATELSDDIDRWLADESVTAYREPLLARFARWRRKHRTLVATLSVLLIMLVLGAGLASWMISSAQAKLNQEQARTLDEQRARLKALNRAEKISNYLFSVLRSPDPKKNAKAYDIRVGAVLDDAVARVEADFKDDPLTRVGIIENVALTWHNLGVSDQAVTLYERALKIRKKISGLHAPETLETMQRLGQTYIALGRNEKAIALLEDCREKRESVGVLADLADAYHAADQHQKVTQLLTSHQDSPQLQSRLARAFNSTGDTDKALTLAEKAFDALKNQGGDHPETLLAMRIQGECCLAKKDHTRAVTLLEKNLHLHEQRFGKSHRSTITTVSSLAQAYLSLRRFDRALPLLERAESARSSDAGEAHPLTIQAKYALARGYHLDAKSSKAVPLLESVRDYHQKRGVVEVASLTLLADSWYHLGQFPKAIPLYQQILKRNPEVRPRLLKAYQVMSRFEEAGKLLADMLEEARNQHKESKELAQQMPALIRNQLTRKKYVEAEKLSRELIRICAAKCPNDGLHFQAKSLLGASLVGLKQLKEAEPLLLAGHEGLAKQKDSALLKRSFQRIVKLYEDSGESVKLRLWRARAKLADVPTFWVLKGRLTNQKPKASHPLHLQQGRYYQLEHFSIGRPKLAIDDPRTGVSIQLVGTSFYYRKGGIQNRETYFQAPRTETYQLKIEGDLGRLGRYAVIIREMDPGETVLDTQAALTNKSPQLASLYYCQDHPIVLKSGVTYLIEQTSTVFDTFLILMSDKSQRSLASNNDIQPGRIRDSRLVFTPNRTATYRARVTTARPGKTGRYRIRVRRVSLPGLSIEEQEPIAAAYHHLGQSHLAIPMWELIHRSRLNRLGASHPETIKIVRQLAIEHAFADQCKKAVPYFEEVHRQTQKADTTQVEKFLATLNYACITWGAGLYDKSVSLMESALKIIPEKLPERARWFVFSMDESLPPPDKRIFKRAMKAMADLHDGVLKRAGRSNKLNLTIWATRSMMTIQDGGWVNLNEISSLFEATLNRYHPHAVALRINLLLSTRQAGEWKKLMQNCKIVAAILGDVHGSDDLRVLEVQCEQVFALKNMKSFTAAVSQIKDTHERLTRAHSEHWLLFRAKSLYGECLTEQKKMEQAESLLLDGYNGLKARVEQIPAHRKHLVRDALERVIRHYKARGKNDKAESFIQERQ